jgi:ligand-binding sensor domain-containing protein/serine phosphatase RsbU (regulator of sigma subunit)
MRLVKIVFCTLTLCFSSAFAHAQKYQLKRYTSRDGLAQNATTALLYDSRGFLWVGTEEGGLSRFDGHKFVTYTKNNGLADNTIYGLAEDEAKNLWIATGNGLSYFNGSTFTNYKSADTLRTGFTALTLDSRNNVWAISEEGEIMKFNGKNFLTFNKLPISPAQPTSLFANEQKIVVGTAYNGLWEFELEVWMAVSQFQRQGFQQVHQIAEVGTEIVVATSAGLFNISSIDSINGLIADTEVLSVATTRAETAELWVGIANGAIRLQPDYLKLEAENGIEGEVRAITNDAEGGTWFATNNGVYRLGPQMFLTYTSDNGLPSNHINSLSFKKNATGATTITAATSRGVVQVVHDSIYTLPALEAEPLWVDYWAGDSLLVATQTALYTLAGDSWQLAARPPDEWGDFRSAAVVNDSLVLLGTSSGLWRLKNDSISADPYLPKGIMVNSILPAAQGQWVATGGAGLWLMLPDSSLHLNRQRGFTYDRLNALAKGPQGNLWLGTSGSGLAKLREANPRELPVNFVELNLSSQNIYALTTDTSGAIWAGSDHGLNKIIPINNDILQAQSYTQLEGFDALDVSRNAIINTEDGYIWVGTSDGLVRVTTDVELYSADPPLLRFEGVDLAYELQINPEHAGGLEPWTGMPLNPSLPADDNHLRFRFVGVQMQLAEQLTYQWRMLGLNDEWSPPTTQAEAIYPNLAPGNYTFEVKAKNARGVASEMIAYSFSIEKHFYQTRGFAVLVVLALLYLAYLLFRNRIKSLQRVQEILKRKVQVRTAELEAKQVQLEAQSNRLKEATIEIEQKNLSLEEANEAITSSIQYAGKLQKSILRSNVQLKQHFPESFNITHIKNLITGDFLYFTERDDLLYVALIDCTTTGVPAAFISILGHDLLNLIVVNSPLALTPSEVLKQLHERMVDLMHTEDDEQLNEGMDIAMLRIERNNKRMLFAGARRPLLYFQNSDLITLKGSFSSIGIHYPGVDPNFEEHEIMLTQLTKVYLYSDGLISQFNDDGQKFKTSNLKKLIKEVSQLPMPHQGAQLDTAFTQWRGKTELIDDLIVIGFCVHC